jgi:hypothetical protein
MKSFAFPLTLALLYISGSALGAQQPALPATEDPLMRVVRVAELKDETIFAEIARLNQGFDIAISIEGLLPAAGKVANPRFTAKIENQNIANVLSWLCDLDTRYTWTRDQDMVNVFPRAFLNDKSYFFNRLLPEVRFQDIQESGAAVMEVVHQLGDPNENLYFMGIGGTQNFAKPWTATFYNITVRQALNQIAHQLGPTYGWQIGGIANQRMIMFHYKLGAASQLKTVPQSQ